jgi:sugar diacid utilization regulator
MLATGDHAIAVLALDEAAARSRAETLLTAADDQFTGEPGWSAIIGVGGARALLTEIRDSYREARAAVRVGTCLPDLGRIIAWSRLGAYRTITMLVGASDPAPMLPEGLLRLLVAHDAPMLVGTLEAYLEHAGDARAAAAAECVHRSTLYHRLRRIEEIAGVELRVGDDRLEMHLAVRLWRLAGSPGPDKLARSHDAASPRPDVRRSQTTDPRRWLPDASGTS